MRISVVCQCGQKFTAQAEDAGKKAKCPQCKAELVIPNGPQDGEVYKDRKLEEIRSLLVDCASCLENISEVVTSQPQYEYHVVATEPAINFSGRNKAQAAANYFAEILKQNCQQGWEFFRVDPLSVYEPPGCLGALLGMPETERHYRVVTFRRKV